MIPEFRYGGIEKDHEHRLDFLIIDPYTFNKYGFELSPWSTHGLLKGTARKTQKEINAMALANFEREMEKHRAYFKRYDIFCRIYTDTLLKNTKKLFDDDIAPLLSPEDSQTKIDFQVMEEMLDG